MPELTATADCGRDCQVAAAMERLHSVSQHIRDLSKVIRERFDIVLSPECVEAPKAEDKPPVPQKARLSMDIDEITDILKQGVDVLEETINRCEV